MSGGDFRSNEVSATLDKAATAKIVLTTDAGEDIVLKDGRQLPAGTVVDATFMSAAGAGGVPRRRDREDQGRGRPVLAAHEGHDDEGLGPDHLRPCGEGLAGAGVREVRRQAWTRWA
jgi:hypothetical protein